MLADQRDLHKQVMTKKLMEVHLNRNLVQTMEAEVLKLQVVKVDMVLEDFLGFFLKVLADILIGMLVAEAQDIMVVLVVLTI